ncbi:origin recognition complex subunit 5 C-terminus-domain-containing protein [Gymnopilus junonius]|uniref:Origin recognition complex subunit 5 C-terminus-domain-containing protein n=1 Tax=Gymnopilus junonius TaxID=109634 RepID=A0A9P5NHU5_GYMJU|nr:origin recognition complex subunit 5 C-terminus-domain-containing protein [Gymnopilus junonius]
MENIQCPIPGYENLADEFGTLISTYPPPFIYIQDTQALRTTLNAIDALLRDLSNLPASSTNPSKIYYSRVDCVASFTSRLFYEAVINTLVGWEPSWEDGCANWSAEGAVGGKWNESMDMFLHGLRAAASTCGSRIKSQSDYDVRFVIVVERAERLKESLPEIIVPLTRLSELSRIDLSVVFISQVGWEDIRPPLGASPDPYYIDIQAPSKESLYPHPLVQHSLTPLTPYHPALESLYSHFVTTLCDVCFPFTHDPNELQYITAARWPGFCKPLLDEHKRRQRKPENEDTDVDMDVDPEDEDREVLHDRGMDFLFQPSTDTRMRLNKLFNPTLSNALEALLPRLSNAADWAKKNEPPPDLLSLPPGQAHLGQSQASKDSSAAAEATSMRFLPRMSKFILLASFVASTNPAKSDIRIFGRGLDEKKRKRRRAAPKMSAKKKSAGPSKVSQRLLGPTSFPLDRMLAILGALLEENEAEWKLPSPQFTIPGEETDMDISRVGIYASVMELTSMRLLHRASPPDRLDGPPQFKCVISHDMALVLAKQLDVALNDLLWDPM